MRRTVFLVVCLLPLASGLAAPTRRVFMGSAIAMQGTGGSSIAALAATDSELKSMLLDTKKEIESGPVKRKKQAPPPNRSDEGGSGVGVVKLPNFGSLSEQAAAEGRARAEKRRASLSSKPVAEKTASADSETVYAELRAKRQAQKDAAAQRTASKKKNLTPIEELKGRN